ncbi:Nif3-like dinuclear metal center hexameric protein [Campylobacter sp. MIT 21-1685]|uniref:Nif3-like dinuclear metal center hexameric protein n=1 Tax=unclassified Campylobacter TaxID=2593542 RepID=UPI00224A8E0E|nr:MULTISPECIES: Nif3-like dinuclear metal center hexameric protein [unclassified Campylobacter]MCX2682798.1 Nif3-like dinuclear metal center hexameric protein [Campylobacter sp. MIT 21-1684]MCX2751056.1 Nif3-like dinuclear metal center hexameric protein [Campylobacter sp. MIT 21-1682]MCX2807279.1 Nif3-like dinuclear metal center hexameric protein [Campylobacter sp. MIT 21-1685]
MKLIEVYEFLNTLSPFETQANWDNSGLLLGNSNDEIEKIYISLDLSKKLVDEFEPNSLCITHHPLLFKALKNLRGEQYPVGIIKDMLLKNISLISLHTNYDLSHLNAYVVSEILGFQSYTQEKFLIYIDVDMCFSKLCELVKKSFNMQFLRVSYCGKKNLRRIAVCVGSGGDLLQEVNADCFLTGDLKYHQAFEAIENQLNLIDIGHFESENYFAQSLARNLQNLSLEVIIRNSKNPFNYV